MSCVIIITAGGEIPFHVIGRKYTEGTNSQSHVYNTPNYVYIEGEAWQEPLQEPLQENRDYII